jgi:molybdenum cofactor guanylyltransferase
MKPNAFVLAGGRSTRMGRDKALLEWQGRPLIQHALEKLRSLGLEPAILGSRPDLERFAPVLADNLPGLGPLGGIEAALSLTDAQLNLFLPVDLPLLPLEFLRWIIARASLTQAAATIPQVESRPQPLCAVYSRELLSGIRSSLHQGDAKVIRAIENAVRNAGLRIDRFDVESIAAAQADPSPWPRTIPVHRWFENLNSPRDLARVSLEQMPPLH